MSSTYKVGQVVYALLRKEAAVFPIQVIEEITKKTLDGEVTTYMVRAGADASKVVALSEVDGEIFDNAEAAKATLVERVTVTVAQRVDQAVARAKEWYPSGHEAVSEDPLTLIRKSETRTSPPQKPVRPVKAEVAALAAEMAAEAAAADNDDPIIELEGGIKARVKSVKMPESLQR
jgi:hypothetical protein